MMMKVYIIKCHYALCQSALVNECVWQHRCRPLQTCNLLRVAADGCLQMWKILFSFARSHEPLGYLDLLLASSNVPEAWGHVDLDSRQLGNHEARLHHGKESCDHSCNQPALLAACGNTSWSSLPSLSQRWKLGTVWSKVIHRQRKAEIGKELAAVDGLSGTLGSEQAEGCRWHQLPRYCWMITRECLGSIQRKKGRGGKKNHKAQRC